MDSKLRIFGIGSLLFLSACGGGSGETKSNPPPADGGNTPPTAQGKFSLDTVKSNYCGIESPYPGVEVLVHDEEGEIITSLATDSQGKLEAEWPVDAAHVTVIGEAKGSGKQVTEITSKLNTGPIDLGVFSFTDSQSKVGCNCRDVRLELGELEASYPDYQFYSSFQTRFLSPSAEMMVEVCDNDDTIDVMLKSDSAAHAIAGQLTIGVESGFVLKPEDFTAEGVPVEVNLAVPDATEFAGNWYSVSWDKRKGQWYHTTQDLANPDNLFVFPELSEVNIVRYFAGDSGIVDGLDFIMGTLSYRTVSDSGEAEAYTPMFPDQGLAEGFISFSDAVTGQGDTMFDFTVFNEKVNTFRLDIGVVDSNNGRLSWLIVAPPKGKIPDLDLPQVYQSRIESGEISSIQFLLSAYGSSSYDDYLREYTEASRSENWYQSELYDDYDYLSFLVYL
jgi:hypothetical protein